MVKSSTLLLFTSLILSQSLHALMLGDAQNGKQLHDSKCITCHTAQFGGDGSGIYTRPNRRVTTVEGLQRQVEFCNKQTQAKFTDDQLNDVIKYLNDQFYKLK